MQRYLVKVPICLAFEPRVNGIPYPGVFPAGGGVHFFGEENPDRGRD
ncbi:hypothetical protein [Aliifodinibius sp. S!AR15-10]|nr:hypothetical protein [Aliifodinibius sp. S!AR15-10]